MDFEPLDAVLVVHDAKGDPDLLIERYNRAAARFDKQPPGTLAHIAVRTEDGMRIFLLMESEEAVNALNEHGGIRRAVRETRLATPSRATTTYNDVYAFHLEGALNMAAAAKS